MPRPENQPARFAHERDPSMALAPRRGVREDQRGAASRPERPRPLAHLSLLETSSR